MFGLTSETPTVGSKPAKLCALPIELGGRLCIARIQTAGAASQRLRPLA